MSECLQCKRRCTLLLCQACSRSSAAQHRGIAAAISKLRGSPCTYCSEPSVGVIAGGSDTLCEFHVRDYKKMDFIQRDGFVTYSSIPALVTG
jgi:hypothetical protein